MTVTPPRRPLGTDVVEQSANDVRRRRVIAAAAVVVGAGGIGATLRVERGSAAFYLAGYALAAVWIVAAILCGPVRWKGPVQPLNTELLIGVAVGAAMFGVFVAADEIGRHVSFLAGPITNLLAKADSGPVAAVLALALVNGAAEELFFRGALTEAIGTNRALVVSTIVYILVTAVAGNTALTLAAVAMGSVLAIVRGWTGGLVAPIVTHLVWSTLVIVALPR